MEITKIIERAKNLIISSDSEWDIIISENENKNSILKNYAIPLILVGALAAFIGHLIGPRFISPSISYSITSAIMAFIIPIISIFISAYIVDALATSFGSKKNIEGAFSLIIYSSTPAFIAAIVANLHWTLSFVNIFSLFSIYLFWKGIDKIMGTPEDKKLAYVIVSYLVIIGVYMILGLIVSSIFISSIFL